MAYLEEALTSHTEVPGKVAAFAAARGWTVAGNTITRPGGGRSFTIGAGTSSVFNQITIQDSADSARLLSSTLPALQGAVNAPLNDAPTKLHLFGNDTPYDPEPWIAFVVELGFNSYRHFYIGNIVKAGDYTGGEIISGNVWFPLTNSNEGARGFNSSYCRYMFCARHVFSQSGGANIVHADNPNPYRNFDTGPNTSSSGGSTLFFTGDEIFGGVGDGLQGGLVRRGQSDFAGANILVPINLFVPDAPTQGSDTRFRPVGYIPGARMVDMRSLEPGALIQVGNENWRVFPEFRKTEETTAARNNLGYYFDNETSHMFGMAYKEG